MTGPYLPWLIFPPAMDLANTVMVTGGGERELLGDGADLDAWIAAERGRIGDVEAAAGRLEEVRELRDCIRELLHARARGKPLPADARARVNELSGAVPARRTIGPDGKAVEELVAPDPFARFQAGIARSAIEIATRPEGELRVCDAPSCGMLFLRDHPRQTWCSKACGNRARVARHARRRRGGRARSTR